MPGIFQRFHDYGCWPYKDESWKAEKKWSQGLQVISLRCRGIKVTTCAQEVEITGTPGRHLLRVQSKPTASMTLPIQLPRTHEASTAVLLGSYMST